MQVSIAADIHAALWEKLLFVGPFGGVGAVTRAPVGVLRRQTETRSLLEGTMREVFVLARARGVRVGDEAIEKALAAHRPLARTGHRFHAAGHHGGSPLRTGVATRRGGAAGAPAGVEVPRHTFLYASLLPQERKAHGEIEFSA